MKINEIYLSVNGEGCNIFGSFLSELVGNYQKYEMRPAFGFGVPTIFIRTTGCNLRCLRCDTTYAYDEGINMTLDCAIKEVDKYEPYRAVLITGGEPGVAENIAELISKLGDRDYYVGVETNGSVDIDVFGTVNVIVMDVKTPSSRMASKMRFSNLKKLKVHDQVKFVIANRKDYDYMKEILDKYPTEAVKLASPCWGIMEPKKLVEWILKDKLDIVFNLQLHKIIWPPDKRGV